MKYLGVDGCAAGWVAIGLDQNGKWSAGIFSDFESLVKAPGDFELLLVDIPIGLKDSGFEERLCDIQARKTLPPGLKSSVFGAPCRKAVYQDDYQKASRANFELTGKKLSRQAWGIVRKIRDVDSFMRNYHHEYARKIRESHPEICFHKISSGKISSPKKTDKGIEERKEILQEVLPETIEVISYILAKYTPGQVKTDDVLDALVLAITSMNFRKLFTLPETPEIDSCGLPMEIVYAEY